MRQYFLLSLILFMPLAFTACGEDDPKLPGNGSRNSNYNYLVPSRPWDGGNNQNNGYGYGYGYGNSSNSNPNDEDIEVNCLVEPCVFGRCITDSSKPTHCECDKGYEGRLCSACAKGFFMQGGQCIPEDPCAMAHCVHGKCIPKNNEAFCDCDEGYTDEKCDKCDTDNGYKLDPNSKTCILDNN